MYMCYTHIYRSLSRVCKPVLCFSFTFMISKKKKTTNIYKSSNYDYVNVLLSYPSTVVLYPFFFFSKE